MDLFRFLLLPLRWYEWLAFCLAIMVPFLTSGAFFVFMGLFNTAFYSALWGIRLFALTNEGEKK